MQLVEGGVFKQSIFSFVDVKAFKSLPVHHVSRGAAQASLGPESWRKSSSEIRTLVLADEAPWKEAQNLFYCQLEKCKVIFAHSGQPVVEEQKGRSSPQDQPTLDFPGRVHVESLPCLLFCLQL